MPAGTIYEVKLMWGETRKSIEWKVAPKELSSGAPRARPSMSIKKSAAQLGAAAAKPALADYQHKYALIGSFTRGRCMDMEQSKEDPFIWEGKIKITARREEDFQIVRDRDLTQIYYPAEHDPDAATPIEGPDDHGAGKGWVARGRHGEQVTVRFRMSKEGDATVSVHHKSGEERMWGAAYVQTVGYFVCGDWNDYEPCAMEADEAKEGVYKFRLSIDGGGQQLFQILKNNSRRLAFYPPNPESSPGEDAPCGPDEGGDGLYWKIRSPPGLDVEIILDLNAQDSPSMVTFKKCYGKSRRTKM
eukprot:gnl/TRDRNA2_/TRDRNA2_90955_c2_seq1.p1 gnl/TRDRNA2_/TRDRNA2_90955_c2~~gnl/TRDRNA2_/TRDRNA2_90955_c2_seq1.p1  ORF type:complete len:321 (+),score=64.44 gnl/TRDRNA2_/TRDRNA2_90955_c2_seq1:60-965(+)